MLAAGPGRCSCARLYGPEDDRDRDADQETTVGANDTNRHSLRDWRRTTHRSPVEFDGTTRQRRRRRCRYCAHPRTSLARSMSGHRGGSRRMSASFVTVWSDGRADTARRCVPKRRCRASVIRRGSAEHPTDNSAAMRRIRSWHAGSIRGRPGRRAPWRQHRANPL
jgi:hypothetical protein